MPVKEERPGKVMFLAQPDQKPQAPRMDKIRYYLAESVILANGTNMMVTLSTIATLWLYGVMVLLKPQNLAPVKRTLKEIFVDSLIYNDVIALILGVIFNALLIMAIRMSRRKSSAQYVKLVLIAAVFDFFFAIEELFSQHQLHVKGGVIYMLAHGVEQLMPPHLYWICIIPHGFFTVHGLFILSGLYHFRYKMMIDVNTSPWMLVRNVGITSLSALLTSCCLTYGIFQGMNERGYGYYYKRLENEWFGKYGQRYFVYAADLDFAGIKAYFFLGLTLASVSVFLIFFYAYKAWKFVNPNAHSSSAKTKLMQAQFTRAILIQTVNAFVFAFFPVGLFTFLAIFRFNGEYLGILVMAVVSWLPAANGAITIYVVKDFRNFVKGFLGCRRLKVMTATVSVVGSSTAPKFSRTTRNPTSQTS
ncbi:unnamed protein product [Bursaphelenchus xylophilus]|uniref:(pine wood nematode) hypothetical protein n=1 Tax=Bursaphelenchus xylophilus TaxID=6326 RepID=A0A1I7SAX1_BURXY|nr:unnamed protein product [Bursaphelenchus xylophilus]CAG9106126.1 unnamed protein product [Bursaphelenchus xylophilus]